MALDFAKLAFDVSLDLTAAFPLDARSYFESLEAAEAAAAEAEPVGSTDSAYYYGQTVVVVEDNNATLYIIQPDKTLSCAGGAIKLNPNQFIYNENGELSLVNSTEEAEKGQVLAVGEDGKLTWTTPLDTYTKEELDLKLASAGKMKRVIVDTVEDIAIDYLDKEDFDSYIFMVPTGLETDADKYDEYIILSIIDEDETPIKYIEKVGSWEINLDDYVKRNELDAYVQKEEGYRLISEEEIEKFSQSEKNVINGVSEDFTITDRVLEISSTGNLQTTLNNKVDKIEGYTLLSPEDQKKLKALNLNGTDLEISGTVQVGNIQGLNEWLTNEGASYIVNLDEGNLSQDLVNKINSGLHQVNSDHFSIVNGTLNLNEEILSKLEPVTGNFVTVENFNTVVGNLDELMSQQINLFDEISELQERLTWQDIVTS